MFHFDLVLVAPLPKGVFHFDLRCLLFLVPSVTATASHMWNVQAKVELLATLVQSFLEEPSS